VDIRLHDVDIFRNPEAEGFPGNLNTLTSLPHVLEDIKMFLPVIALHIELARHNHDCAPFGIDFRNAPQPDTKTPETLLNPSVRAVQAIMLMPVHSHSGPHGPRQVIKNFETIDVVPSGFVRDEDIGPHVGQVIKLIRINGRPMFSVDAPPPPILPRRRLSVFLAVAEIWRGRETGMPDQASENAPESSDANPIGQLHNASMDIPLGKLAIPNVHKILIRIRIVIAVDVPDSIKNLFEFNMQGPLWLHVAQKDDRGCV
jgi:hypothetical protein